MQLPQTVKNKVGKTSKKHTRGKTSKGKSAYYLKKIFEKFTYALYIFVEPQTVIAFSLTVGFFILAYYQTGLTRTVLEIVGILTTTWLVEVSTQNLIKASGDTYLAKKSGSSIRNLQLIKYKIANIATRINATRKKQNNRDFDEIENLIQNIDKDILNSISDWADVNPNSQKIVDFFESIAQKEKIVRKLEKEKKALHAEKQKISKDKTEEINALESEINYKEGLISDLESQVSGQNLANLNILSGSASSPVSGTPISPHAPGGILTQAGSVSVPELQVDLKAVDDTPLSLADFLRSDKKKKQKE